MAEQRISFFKMTGSGNDFLIIDNRSLGMSREEGRQLARLACRRKVSAGADGLILIEDDPEVDFKWQFFNADGSEAEMCGNGSRCAARFVYLNGIVDKEKISFRTLAGIIDAEIKGERVKVRMTPPHNMETDIRLPLEDGAALTLHYINTGVPHVVSFVENEAQLENLDVFHLGRTLRFHPRFQPAGSNANFALVHGPHNLAVRTYERGVEAETLACGTGSIASALIAAAKGLVASPVEVKPRSGENLVIHFDKVAREDTIEFFDVCLEGDAKVVYDGHLWEDTLRR
jgi:diaminopimelate epimerase